MHACMHACMHAHSNRTVHLTGQLRLAVQCTCTTAPYVHYVHFYSVDTSYFTLHIFFSTQCTHFFYAPYVSFFTLYILTTFYSVDTLFYAFPISSYTPYTFPSLLYTLPSILFTAHFGTIQPSFYTFSRLPSMLSKYFFLYSLDTSFSTLHTSF
jgi:hypothetical protein